MKAAGGAGSSAGGTGSREPACATTDERELTKENELSGNRKIRQRRAIDLLIIFNTDIFYSVCPSFTRSLGLDWVGQKTYKNAVLSRPKDWRGLGPLTLVKSTPIPYNMPWKEKPACTETT